MNFISSASLENLVPLAAYDFKETGTLQRFPYVVGVFWGSFMIVGCWVWGLFTPEVALSFADFPQLVFASVFMGAIAGGLLKFANRRTWRHSILEAQNP